MTTADDWIRCRPWIVAALETCPLETIESVERGISDKSLQFWAGEKSAAITQVQTFERMKVLMVVHGGGDLEELMIEMEPHFAAFAKAMGCSAIGGAGRLGWKRVSEKHGYRFGFVTMFKDLKNG